jgi:PAS domain-containing protein
MSNRIGNRVWLLSWMITLVLIISAGIDVNKLRSSVLDEKTQQTRQLVETAYGVLNHYQQEVIAGKISKVAAQKAASAAVRELRYGNNDYFWINDRTNPIPRMVMHPTQSQLEGRILDSAQFNTATHYQHGNTGIFDPTPDRVNLFGLINSVIDQSGHGFIRYEWAKPATLSADSVTAPKMSYVRLFEPWDWVIGTGIYIDDIDHLINQQIAYLLARTLIATLFLLGITLVLVRSIDAIQARLTNQKIQMQALIDATTESVLLLDAEGKVLAMNQFAAQRFHRTLDSILEKNFFDLLPTSLANSRKSACDEVIRSGEAMVSRDERDGISFENSIYPVPDQKGEITSVAVFAKDVTEQQRIASTENLFRHLDTVVLKWQMDSVSVAQIFCDSVLPIFDLSGAWISKAETDGALTLLAISDSTTHPFINPEHLPDHWRCSPDFKCSGECSTKWPKACVSIQSGQQKLCPTKGETPNNHWEAAVAIGIESSLALPITLQEHKWGVLTVYSKQGESLEKAQRLLVTLTNRLAAILESALQHENSSLLNAAFAEISSAVFILNGAAEIVWTNSVLTELTHYQSKDLISQPVSTLCGSQLEPLQSIQSTIRNKKPWSRDVSISTKEGQTLSCQLVIKPIQNSKLSAPHFIGIIDTWLSQ